MDDTLLIAKAVLRNRKASRVIHQPVYLSESTVVACSRAARHLDQMRINAEEQELLEQTTKIEDVEEIIATYIQEIERSRSRNSKAWKKVYAFSKFAGPVLEVFKQANFSPECSLALGLVGLLLIQPLNNKSEIEERLAIEINQLGEVLAQVKFTNSFIKTREVDIEIEGLCATIVDFLLHALQYQKKWGIVRVMGSIITDFAKKFENFVAKLKRHTSKVEVLAQRNYTTVLIQSKTLLDANSQVLADLQSRLSAQAITTSTAISRLEDSLLRCQLSIATQSRAEAIKYSHQLSKALLPTDFDALNARPFIRGEETLLAPRERWENNVSEIQAPGCLELSPRPLLWIGGKRNYRGVSWVSSFSADLVEASEPEKGIDIASVLCNNGTIEEGKQTPTLIFKKLVLQLLRKYPDILTVTRHLEKLPVERFEQVQESPERAFDILSDILKMINQHCKQERKETFILIDRIDIFLLTEPPPRRRRFLRALRQLSVEYKTLRVILTGQCPWEVMDADTDAAHAVTEIWVDTTRPSAMQSRR